MKKLLLVLGFIMCFLGVKQAKAATLSLSPSSGSYGMGQTFDVKLNLDTAGQQIDGVDIFHLNFDPSILQVVDSDSKTSGVQIKAGTLFPITAANTVDQSAGKITFSQVTTGGTHYSGSGVLATISMRALKTGSANLTFDFTKGSTSDTNVAGSSTDQLTQVTNANFTISDQAVTLPATQNQDTDTETPTDTTTDTTPTETPTPASSSNKLINILGYSLGGLILLGAGLWLAVRNK